MMETQPKAIVLGGTCPHIALIENLKNRGYYTVLIDYYENPPAKIVADEHIRESTLDQEKVLQIAKTIEAKLVISTCIDQANVTACYVAEKLGLPAPYSYKTALDVSNKGLMKKKMFENGIPTSKYVFVDDVSEIEPSNLEFPIIVKPVDCCGSAGVKKVNSILELNIYLKEALKISRTHKAIVEEFKEGIELSVYSFVKNKVANIIMISQRLSVIDGDKSVMKCFATIAPANISEEAKIKIQQIANKIAETFDLDNTSLHIQVLVNRDEVNVIEFAPRVGGGVSYRTIKLNTGFDIINATIESYLGIDTEVVYKQPEHYFSVNLIYAKPGIFKCITGYQKLIEEQVIIELFNYKTKGMEISSDKASSSRVGSFLIKASNMEELFIKTKRAIDELEVYDINGNPIMRKDLYFREEL